jgi:import receptor subunit TOM20
MPSNTQIALTGLAVVATGFVGYAAWFDYKRRNDPVFRKNLSECISRTVLAALGMRK